MGQVLVADLAIHICRLPVALLRQVQHVMPGAALKVGRAVRHEVVARLLGLGSRMVESLMSNLAEHSWVPAAPAPSRVVGRIGACLRRRPALPVGEGRQRALRTLKILVREALSGASQGHSDVSYTSSVARLQLAGVDVGEKYHSHEFAELVEHLGMQAVRWGAFNALKTILPGIGIPSDFSIVFDPVSIVAKAYSRSETLVPMSCFASHPRTAELYNRLLAAPSQGASHQGVHTKEVVLGALVTDTWEGASRRRLQASLVVVRGRRRPCSWRRGCAPREYASSRAYIQRPVSDCGRRPYVVGLVPPSRNSSWPSSGASPAGD